MDAHAQCAGVNHDMAPLTNALIWVMTDVVVVPQNSVASQASKRYIEVQQQGWNSYGTLVLKLSTWVDVSCLGSSLAQHDTGFRDEGTFACYTCTCEVYTPTAITFSYEHHFLRSTYHFEALHKHSRCCPPFWEHQSHLWWAMDKNVSRGWNCTWGLMPTCNSL